MKLLAFILLLTCFIASAHRGYAQITLSEKNVPLQKVFKEIQRQSGFEFFYSADVLEKAGPVTVNVTNVSVKQAIEATLKGKDLTFEIIGKTVAIKETPSSKDDLRSSTIDVQGRIVDENGNPVIATVRVKGSSKAVSTGESGDYMLKAIPANSILIISATNIETAEIEVNRRTNLGVYPVIVKVSPLDEMQIIAYGSTSKRLNTGDVSTVKKEDIQKQPVSNPLAALEGRVPGLLVTQNGGIPGGAFKVQLRGQGSILQGTEPLFIIDGVPFTPGNSAINLLTNSSGSAGLSPFNLIPPSDIESIEVLKDADATSIYGSRGANGVILITTKKSHSGKTRVSGGLSIGFSRVTRTMDMLSTNEYRQMRREAFANDGVTPTITNAPDLMLWDSAYNFDMKSFLIGGTAQTTEANVSVTGGNQTNSLFLGASYNRETTVFPGDLANRRSTLHFSSNHTSSNKKLTVGVDASFSFDNNNLVSTDLTGSLRLPPNLHLYDSLGGLNWSEKGTSFRSSFGTNPLAYLKKNYIGQFQNLLSNVKIAYNLFSSLKINANFGYNTINTDETLINPKSSIDIASSALASSNFGQANLRTWIIEPRIEWERKVRSGKLSLLVGSSLQESKNKSVTITGSNYSSDLLLYSVSSAANITATTNQLQYRYVAFYSRFNYNYSNKYIVNLSARRDGSSRFGPDTRFNNFAAIGGAWLFSNAKVLAGSKILSFGKIRASYGVTGNDQIGDYQYLDTWSTSNPTTYQSIAAIRPSRLYNSDYAWEKNRKQEIGVEVGFFKDRLLLNASFFRNRSSNQLVNYTLPSQSGFSSILRNLDATVQNEGLELQFTSNNINTPKFSWKTSLNFTRHRNKLLDFPGLQSSSYANTYVIGQPLGINKLYHYLGVDPNSGVYQFEDYDKNGSLTTADRLILKTTNPNFYGGLQNNLAFGNLELSIFLEFRKQQGLNYLYNQGSSVPGYAYINQPSIVMNRWQGSGTQSTIQRFTQNFASPAYTAATSYLVSSDAVYSDASFIRLKTLELQYHLGSKLQRFLKIFSADIYLRCQNLFTITKYIGADPENQNLYILPPLRTISGGITITL